MLKRTRNLAEAVKMTDEQRELLVKYYNAGLMQFGVEMLEGTDSQILNLDVPTFTGGMAIALIAAWEAGLLSANPDEIMTAAGWVDTDSQEMQMNELANTDAPEVLQ